MRDPYDVLGLKRGATIEEIKAAYRRLSKQRHPDSGGSNEAMSELNVAYHAILDELKRNYQDEQARETNERKARAAQEEWRNVDENSTADTHRDRWWRDRYREVDEELETLRRYAEEQGEQLRRMREDAWRAGHHIDWAQLTIEDILRFFKSIARSGVKGVALLFAALVGIGSLLVEANVISTIVVLGSVIGVLVAFAFKSNKGGAYVIIAGVLTLYVLFVLLSGVTRRPQVVTDIGPPRYTPAATPTFTPSPSSTQTFSYAPEPPPTPPAPAPPAEPRTLMASDGAILKFAVGVPYRLKVRTGRTTNLLATSGTVRAETGAGPSSDCVDSLHFLPGPGAGPWRDIDTTYRSCTGDAIMTVRLGM